MNTHSAGSGRCAIFRGWARRLAVAVILFLPLAEVAGSEWTRFRGPNGSGVAEADIPAEWTESTYKWQETNERAISSPIVFGDLIMGTCGFTNYPKHAVAMRLTEKDGFEELWRVERSIPHIPSPIYVNNLMFFWDDAGIVTCLEPKTGEVIYRERVEAKGEVFGSPVSDGKRIFCADKEAMVSVIEASDEFKLLAQNELGDVCRTTPAIEGGAMYVRTFNYLYAIPGR